MSFNGISFITSFVKISSIQTIEGGTDKHSMMISQIYSLSLRLECRPRTSYKIAWSAVCALASIGQWAFLNGYIYIYKHKILMSTRGTKWEVTGRWTLSEPTIHFVETNFIILIYACSSEEVCSLRLFYLKTYVMHVWSPYYIPRPSHSSWFNLVKNENYECANCVICPIFLLLPLLSV